VISFDDPQVEKVLQRFEERRHADAAAMESLGAEVYGRRDEFLLPVGLEAGWFLHSLIIARAPRRILELGTSYGYSTLFLADAANKVGARVVTMDLAEYKQAHAASELAAAGLAHVVDFRLGDALEMIGAEAGEFDFVLLDIWKELYESCFQAFYPKLSEEAIIVSDNMIEPAGARPQVRRYREALKAKSDLQSALLPVGQGMELTVKWSADNAKL
jgi:predicted O-methyltransferase YrrM